MADAVTPREILEFVARGEISPGDAAELLARLETTPPSAAPPAAPPMPAALSEPAAPAKTRPIGSDFAGAGTETEPQDEVEPDVDLDLDLDGDHRIAKVQVRSTCQAVVIVGDDNVHTAVAEGEHGARVEGDTLVIEAILDRAQGFAFVRGAGVSAFSAARRGRARVRTRINESDRPLVVRMNPRLALSATVDAGSMNVEGVHGPVTARVQAGALHIEDFDAPLDLKVAAGSATVSGRMTTGTSRIECDAGKVSVRLSPDSSVKVSANVTLGDLVTPRVVGNGDARLDVVANLSSVHISVEGE